MSRKDPYFSFKDRDSVEYKPQYGTAYTPRQEKILSGELPLEDIRPNELSLLKQKAKHLGDMEGTTIAEVDVEKENVERVLFQQFYRLRTASGLKDLGVRQKIFNLAHERYTGILFIIDHGNTHRNTLLLLSVRHLRWDERQRERHGRAFVAAVDMKVALFTVNAAQAFPYVEKACVGRVAPATYFSAASEETIFSAAVHIRS